MSLKDKQVKRYIIEQCKAGVSRKEIAQDLAAAGHTNRRGKPVTAQDVSYYASKWGYPKNRKRRTKKEVRTITPTYTDLGADTILTDVTDIVTSTLSPALKKRLLLNLISMG